jgi:molecular chaperone Hsp33
MLAPHAYPPALAGVLVELAGSAVLLAAALKFDGTLIVQLAGSGPARLIVVECNPSLAVRATAQWDEQRVRALPADATLEALAGGAGSARLAITLDPRDGGAMYQGIVALTAATVADTIAHYLETSEQVVSRLRLEREGDTLAGMLLQRMPASGTDDDATWSRASEALARCPGPALVKAAGDDEGLVALFPGEDLRVFTPATPHFQCSCSVQRVEGALRIAGRAEIEAALADRGEVEVTCEFCGRRYRFGVEDARALFTPDGGNPGSSTRH